MTKILLQLSPFLRKITYLPCTVMGSWSTHAMETIIFSIFDPNNSTVCTQLIVYST